jgi:hypothetical protein
VSILTPIVVSAISRSDSKALIEQTNKCLEISATPNPSSRNYPEVLLWTTTTRWEYSTSTK